MPYYIKLGTIPNQRHIQFRRPDGALYSEEVFGTEGFVGPTTTMYHIHPPTQVMGWKTLYDTTPRYVETDTMRMRHLVSTQMKKKGDPVTGRTIILGNTDVEMSICNPADPMPYHYKNAQGDECLFIHYGSGTVRTFLGTLRFGPKDYIIIPKGIIYKMTFDERPGGETGDGSDNDGDNGAFGGQTKAEMPYGKFLCFEIVNASHYVPPPRYLSKTTSQFLEHAPYCERDLVIPGVDDQFPLYTDEMGDFEVRIKARNCIHSYMYDYHPCDIVGWDGCYYPYIFNIDSFAPITGKLHMPPPIHQTFEGHNFVICSFCPRILDFHPQAIPVPYNHSNLDSDEVLYYVEGNYKARKGIAVGSVSLHPQGIAHGPHPGTIEKSLGATYTDELAVMCDTFRPLFPTQEALDIDDITYPESWKGEHFPQSTNVNGTASGGARTPAHAPDTRKVMNTWD